MGSRKVRKSEAQRRDERAPTSGKARRARTLRDLPSYAEPHDERATNPVIRLTERVTALPPPLPPEGSAPDHSLEALALLARRSSPPPRASATPRLVAPVAPVTASAPTVAPVAAASIRPSSIPAVTVGASNAPGYSETSRPRRRASDHGPRRGGLGTIVLSATVGAIVALGMWTLRSGLDRVARENGPKPPVAALAAAAVPPADKCPSTVSTAPAAPSAAAQGAPEAASTVESEPKPVSIHALPVTQGFSAVPARTERTIRAHVAAPSRASLVSASSNTSAPGARPAVHRAPAAPVSPREAVARAVQRASFAARSCESGPQNGKVEVTFAPTGAVSSVNLIKGFGDVGINGCVLRAFGRVRSAPFEGDPVTVRKTVAW